MRVSQFFLSTTKEAPADAEIVSHRLMLRAGLIRRLAGGIYSWLPLGLRVVRKVEAIVREEMNRAGAIEVFMPAVQPAELWQESGRWQRYGKDVGPKTTLLLLGDARNNYHATQSWVVREMQHRARHVYWLNPEPRSYWDTGDSIIGEYAVHCDGVFECRNLRQLERFVDHLV